MHIEVHACQIALSQLLHSQLHHILKCAFSQAKRVYFYDDLMNICYVRIVFVMLNCMTTSNQTNKQTKFKSPKTHKHCASVLLTVRPGSFNVWVWVIEKMISEYEFICGCSLIRYGELVLSHSNALK